MNIAGTQPHSNAGKEREALTRLTERLKGQFPHLPPRHIERLVQSHHADFNDRPVRDFVPILVERAVRTRLEDETRSKS